MQIIPFSLYDQTLICSLYLKGLSTLMCGCAWRRRNWDCSVLCNIFGNCLHWFYHYPVYPQGTTGHYPVYPQSTIGPQSTLEVPLGPQSTLKRPLGITQSTLKVSSVPSRYRWAYIGLKLSHQLVLSLRGYLTWTLCPVVNHWFMCELDIYLKRGRFGYVYKASLTKYAIGQKA